MYQYFLRFYFPTIRRLFPQIFLPFSIIVGFLGYNVEGLLSDKYTPSIPSAQEQREERLNTDKLEIDIGSLKDKKFVPKSVFEKNLNPSLVEADDRAKKHQKSN